MTNENADAARQSERSLTASVKLYYDILVPSADDGASGPRPLLVALHGYGANKRQMMREARAVAPAHFALASLQGFHQHIRDPLEPGGPLRFGFGWVTNFQADESISLHHRALLDLIATLTREGIADAARIFLLGFSQSCALNYRFAFTHPEVLRGIVGICGGLPGDWDASPLYKETSASVLHLNGATDEFYTPARVQDYLPRLQERARDVTVKNYPAGHEMTPAMREDTRAWLAERAAA
ncbi:MAG: phospholipase/carboxylesterase [Blastocatellia bacterium]|nr:phospholipase/carboxylesterase [Blastocatellia bacterium]